MVSKYLREGNEAPRISQSEKSVEVIITVNAIFVE